MHFSLSTVFHTSRNHINSLKREDFKGKLRKEGRVTVCSVLKTKQKAIDKDTNVVLWNATLHCFT